MSSLPAFTATPPRAAACIASLLLISGGAFAQDAPAPASTRAPPVVTTTPMVMPDGSTGPSTASTVSNAPIPDSVENRRLYGGPDSAGGRATEPHPGPVVKTHARTAARHRHPTPKP